MTSTALLTDEQLMSQHCREMEAWDDACWDLVIDSGPSHIYAATGQHKFEAYWRTLIFDTDPENRGAVAPPELKSSYEHWASSFGTLNNLERLQTERPPAFGLAQAMDQASVATVQAMRGQAFDGAFRTRLGESLAQPGRATSAGCLSRPERATWCATLKETRSLSLSDGAKRTVTG